MSHQPSAQPDPLWPIIAKDIDNAVADLPPTDRDALLLRYFSGKSINEIAATLAISEPAAQKRLQRALEALQKLLLSRGFTTASALALATTLSAHAVHAAPPTLASTITTTLTTKAVIPLTAKGNLKTTLIVAAALALIAGVGTWICLSWNTGPARLSIPSPITLNAQSVLSGPTFTVSRAFGPADTFSLQAQGIIDLSNGAYLTNAAGVITGPVTTNTGNHPGELFLNATGTPPGTPYPYGAILLGNAVSDFTPSSPQMLPQASATPPLPAN